jgi:uncharacterized protein (DUF302 family)
MERDNAEPMKQIVYGRLDPRALSYQNAASSTLPFEQVVERLRQAIAAADLWVLHEIDPQMIVRRDHYRLGNARQILFFHPQLLARVFSIDPALLLEAPLKFAVIELDAGETVVRWIDPVESFGRYGHPEMIAIGRELALTCRLIVDHALSDQGS